MAWLALLIMPVSLVLPCRCSLPPCSSLHFYNLKAGLTQPQMLVVTELDDPFVPLPDDLLVNLRDRCVRAWSDACCTVSPRCGCRLHPHPTPPQAPPRLRARQGMRGACTRRRPLDA